LLKSITGLGIDKEIKLMPTSEEKLTALVEDLKQLSSYLHDQGDKKLALARKFEDNARKDPSNREFDQRQAVMLDYQHHIWHEIGNMVDKLIKQHEHEG
jgi:hypothetical protein